MIGRIENSPLFRETLILLLQVMPQTSDTSILRKMIRSFTKLQILSGRLNRIGGSTSRKIKLTAGV